ncbi:hypothetical protein COLO4_36730 [Corchorus olitorius]|uniref:Uncharacterized protein n=1 Tax=Corchorus olitorius TaxID=93759 RepID=A0A1R3G5W0_9ROSI|nr:hypothetical protein COLO4_36730 [Corchorus olitorius]
MSINTKNFRSIHFKGQLPQPSLVSLLHRKSPQSPVHRVPPLKPSPELRLWLKFHQRARRVVLFPDLELALPKSRHNPLDLGFAEPNFKLSDLEIWPWERARTKSEKESKG